MREITIENVSQGLNNEDCAMESSANQVGNDPIDYDSTLCPVLVAVCSTFAYLKSSKCAQGKTVIHIFDPDNRKTISQLLTAKWDPYCQLILFHPSNNPYMLSLCMQATNVIMCNATATNVMIESGWHYLACPRCSKKVLGDNGDLWCTKCEAKVDMPIARYMLRFKVEDHTGTTVFVALDSEIQKLVRLTAAELIGTYEDNAKETIMYGFSQILLKDVDLQITLNSFKMKQKVRTSFTITRLNTNTMPAHSGFGKGSFASVKMEGNSSNVDDLLAKKARLNETIQMDDTEAN
ncbi:hypothetical protein MKW98_000851 [Papaver atlanticum]|uniref:Replication factor A C-terminal domain-containing protein n=1 Tax=Papaver atlanticum TaxID=357466 RepID=A0AAD4SD14_9MAGN|nr:hypothetical protein MKW98_000851 [Papaver atlanticum]